MDVRAALMVAAVLVGGASAGTGSAAPPSTTATFQDSTGEDALAPDVTTVSVSSDATGMLAFRINIANRPKLAGHMDIRVELDTDLNQNDGCGSACDGSDMILDLVPGSVAVGRWQGSKWDFSSRAPASLAYAYAGGTATIKVKASDLGLTKFNFWVLADSNSTDPHSHVDYAPDAGHGAWSFQVGLAVAKCKAGQTSTVLKPCL